jgi:hypothetical protein
LDQPFRIFPDRGDIFTRYAYGDQIHQRFFRVCVLGEHAIVDVHRLVKAPREL